MINAKTAKRLAFAEEYEGDDYENNPQLRYIMAKAIEPVELKKQLAASRQVQQQIIMQTEMVVNDRLDGETYA